MDPTRKKKLKEAEGRTPLASKGKSENHNTTEEKRYYLYIAYL